MAVRETSIAGLFVVSWPTHGDERGFFRQTFQTSELSEALGYEPVIRQGNHARSQAGVLRGLHAEPWDKIVQVIRGTAFCAIADVRPDSPTFGTAETFLLGDGAGAERARLFVSDGLANSYQVVEGPCDYVYDVTAEWSPDVGKRPIAWDDADLAIDWPVGNPIVSEEDQKNPTLREAFPDHPRWN